MLELEVRRYLPSDREAVWNLHVLGLQQTGAYLESGPWDSDLQHIELVYLENQGELLVVLHDGRLIGMGALRKTGGDLAEIKRMRVHPDFQGQGIGQQLLSRLEQRAGELGYRRLQLDTSTKQLAAQRLYRKNGFHETHRRIIQGLECIFLEKTLMRPEEEIG